MRIAVQCSFIFYRIERYCSSTTITIAIAAPHAVHMLSVIRNVCVFFFPLSLSLSASPRLMSSPFYCGFHFKQISNRWLFCAFCVVALTSDAHVFVYFIAMHSERQKKANEIGEHIKSGYMFSTYFIWFYLFRSPFGAVKIEMDKEYVCLQVCGMWLSVSECSIAVPSPIPPCVPVQRNHTHTHTHISQ